MKCFRLRCYVNNSFLVFHQGTKHSKTIKHSRFALVFHTVCSCLDPLMKHSNSLFTYNVNSYIRKWLHIPISGTLSTVFLTRNKFGLSICPPTVKFIQCQTVLRKALKTSPNEAINELWKATSNCKNIQYDVYNSTKQVPKDFRSGQEDKLHTQLTCQGSFFTNITKFSLSQLTKI